MLFGIRKKIFEAELNKLVAKYVNKRRTAIKKYLIELEKDNVTTEEYQKLREHINELNEFENDVNELRKIYFNS